MSVIDRPGRWRCDDWSDNHWFDAYFHDGESWHGLNQRGKHDFWKGESNDWTYVGPLPDATPDDINFLLGEVRRLERERDMAVTVAKNAAIEIARLKAATGHLQQELHAAQSRGS